MTTDFQVQFSAVQTRREIAALAPELEFATDVFEAFGASEHQVVECAEEQQQVRRQSRIRLHRNLPDWMRQAVGDQLGYLDYFSVDRESGRIFWSMSPLESHSLPIQTGCGIDGCIELADHGVETIATFSGQIRAELPRASHRVLEFLRFEVEHFARAVDMTLRRHASRYRPAPGLMRSP